MHRFIFLFAAPTDHRTSYSNLSYTTTFNIQAYPQKGSPFAFSFLGRFVTILISLQCLTIASLYSQTTWTGASDSDWGTATNWSAGVPDAADEVIIPNVAMAPDPIIDEAAFAKSVTVESGATLTIAATKSLTIDSYSTTPSILNQGTVENNGIINIGQTTNAGDMGIRNESTFYNNTGGQINIDRTYSIGLWNFSGGTFINAATISIGAVAGVGGFGLFNLSTFNNNIGGQINIDRSNDVGLNNPDGTTFNNSATITIGSIASAGYIGLQNGAIFNNNAGGQITIDRTTQYGLWNLNGSFTNAATITIGAVASVGQHGILTVSTFNNSSGGQINIDRSTNSGLYVAGGTFSNSATITIGAVASVGGIGINNESTLSNNAGGQIKIDRSDGIGILNYYGGTLTNEATITIGAEANVGLYGILNNSTFTNNLGGHIDIDRSNDAALQNSWDGYFTNAANIYIGSVESVGNGLINVSIFNNNTGGQIKIDRSGGTGLVNDATFTNAGTITIGGVASVISGLGNSGTFNNNLGGQIKIDRFYSAFINYLFATFNNAATINIGDASASMGPDGVDNVGTFNNLTGGQITINRTTGFGLSNGGTLNNASFITIGSVASVGQYGIVSAGGSFNNNFGGHIKIDNSTISGIHLNNSGSFSNAAHLTIGELTPITDLITATPGGAFNNNVGGVLKGTGTLPAAAFANAGGQLAPGYSPGQMIFDADADFTNCTMAIEVAGKVTPGTDFDQIVVNGTAMLGGTLALTITFSTANAGDQVPILVSTTRTGVFASVTGLPPNWFINYTSTSVILSYGAVLPVELAFFEANNEAKNVRLNWQTISETNNRGFVIERSADGFSWEKTGFVNGKGTSTERSEYLFFDKKPLAGQSFYRLQQMDFDGKGQLSNVVSIDRKREKGMTVVPNPALVDGFFTIFLDEKGKAETVVVRLFDATGRLVKRQNFNKENGSTVSTDGLAAGLFVLEIEADGERFFEKIMVR